MSKGDGRNIMRKCMCVCFVLPYTRMSLAWLLLLGRKNANVTSTLCQHVS